MRLPHVEVQSEQIQAFCRKWKIRELSLFGSVTREDFGPSSDIDVLVRFEPGAGLTFENHPEMADELEAIFGRRVDLVDQRLVRNPFRRDAILKGRKVIYAA